MHDRDYAEINIVSREHQQYLSAKKIRKVAELTILYFPAILSCSSSEGL